MVSRIRGLGMEVSCLQQLHTLPVHTSLPYLALCPTLRPQQSHPLRVLAMPWTSRKERSTRI